MPSEITQRKKMSQQIWWTTVCLMIKVQYLLRSHTKEMPSREITLKENNLGKSDNPMIA